MSDLILKNIGCLYGILDSTTLLLKGEDMNTVKSISNAWISIQNGKIEDFGPMDTFENTNNSKTVDMQGKVVFPGLIDSHTHLVFPKTREEEFAMKIKGATYAEIAAAGGGILNSARALREITENDLLEASQKRLHKLITFGTVGIEIKSGYGLDFEGEIKQLKTIQSLKMTSPIPIRSTLLAAHALPAEFKNNREDYLNYILEKLIPYTYQENLADYVDVFCEENFFTTEETERIILKAKEFGIKSKIHANQLANSGGVQIACKHHAISADHLENIGLEEIEAFKNSNTLPVALPGCSFYLNMQYTPARQIIDNGLAMVIASDFNPGSAPSGNLLFSWSLACSKMKLSPQEAFNALTINAAAALEWENILGSITVGKMASFMVFEPNTTLEQIPYHFAMLNPTQMIINGNFYTN
jgi:imidazolonepropionase